MAQLDEFEGTVLFGYDQGGVAPLGYRRQCGAARQCGGIVGLAQVSEDGELQMLSMKRCQSFGPLFVAEMAGDGTHPLL